MESASGVEVKRAGVSMDCTQHTPQEMATIMIRASMRAQNTEEVIIFTPGYTDCRGGGERTT